MTVFVGRKEELARLESIRAKAFAGEGRIALVTGEAGIGKTRIAEELVRGTGRVIWGRCWEAGGAPPFWPWMEALRDLDKGDPFARVESDGGAAARLKLMGDVLAVLRTIDEKITLVLDDLHCADAPSLMLLHFVSRRLQGIPIFVIGTARETIPHESVEIYAKISREAEVLSLGRLGRDDIATLAGKNADDIHRVTEGNPLFVTEVLRLGTTSTIGLRALLDEHIKELSARSREIVEAAAILGRDFTEEDAAVVAGQEPDVVFEALREAEGLGIVRRRNEIRSFSHMLFCEHLTSALTPSKRVLLHWRAGEAHLARHDLVRAAHHLLSGAKDPVRAATIARRAVDVLIARLAFEDATALAQRALGVIDKESPLACDLLIVLGEALIRAGNGKRGRELAVSAAAQAKLLDEPILRARAALMYALESASGRVDPVMVDLLVSSLAALPTEDHPLRARVMARLAAAMVPPTKDTVPEIVRLANEARDMARRIGDPDTLLFVLIFCNAAIGYFMSTAERYVSVDELMKLATLLDRPLTIAQILPFLFVTRLESGRRPEAEQALERLTELVKDFPAAHYLWRVRGLEAVLAMFDGDFDRAEHLAEEMRAITEAPGPQFEVAHGLLHVGLAHLRGRPESIAPRADHLLSVFRAIPPLAPWTAWVLAATGKRDEAHEMLRRITIDRDNFPWLIIAGDVATMLGDRELAAPLYEKLREQGFKNRAFWGPAGITMFGPTPRILGDLAMLLGKSEEAAIHYADARALCEKMGARSLLKLCGAQSAPPVSKKTDLRIELSRDGEIWNLRTSTGAVIRLKDAKGIAYLDVLIRRVNEEIHVADLAGAVDVGDAGPVLDARAKDEYKQRLGDLKEDLDEAERFGDEGRASRIREELDAIAEELARGVGLGGRDRKAASQVERARINVQRRIKDVIDRVREQDETLGRYLDSTVKTGTYCSFRPV